MTAITPASTYYAQLGIDELHGRIARHGRRFRAAATRQMGKARDFTPTNPLDEWLDVNDEPGLAVMALKAQGVIEVTEINGTHYAREAQQR